MSDNQIGDTLPLTPGELLCGRGGFGDRLGDTECEFAAYWYVIYCQAKGGWVSPTREDVINWYRMSGGRLEGWGTYIVRGMASLAEAGLLEQHGDNFAMTAELLELLQTQGAWTSNQKARLAKEIYDGRVTRA